MTTTYLSCNAAKTKGCAWSADYTGYNGQFPSLECVTTGCRNCTLYDGSPIPPTQQQPIGRNQFSVDPVSAAANPAPFDLNTCYTPSNPAQLQRSYKIFCDFNDIPVEWRNLNRPILTRLTPDQEIEVQQLNN